MDVLHPQSPPRSLASSRLNPNAPIFVPMKSYQTVEDFSDQWWDLVHSSPFFRDYWLQDCFDDVVDDFDLSDFDDAFEELHPPKPEEKVAVVAAEEKREKELISMAALKWIGSNGKPVEAPKYCEKAPKVVKSVKVNPRTIHQPR
ncbi:uncharacterized protein LOC110699354 [Chenopodium quinoa]|uniref:uncharacterized protein LOC110699354 n=1 Tax=Chenopodium quinoa TaxID=63459 RepID=UPI000B799809|nr:uncharacterized protein LOC110699354 [Chenopodium quinoa]